MRTDAEALLNDLNRRGVLLAAEGDKLRIKAPVGALTPRNKQELATRKFELLAALRSRRTSAPGGHLNSGSKNLSKPVSSSNAPSSKMTVYSVVVDGKQITALVPPGLSDEDAKRNIINRFGADRVTRVY